MNASQRPRPVRSGAQPRGELVEEVANTVRDDVVDGDAIDARRAAVGTDLAPGPAHDVAAGDLVIQSVEAAIPVLLGTAVQHALESTNPVHALGVADGPSRYGTHQSPSAPSRASMKCGPFPMWPAFPTPEYHDPLRLPHDHPMPLPGFAGYRPGIASHPPTASGVETALPSSQDDRSHVQRPYTPEGFSAHSWNKNASRGLRPARTGSAPSLTRPEAGPLNDASPGLHTRCRPHDRSRPASHPASRPRTGASLPGTQASPRTGLTPAGRPELVASTSCRTSFLHGAEAVSAHPRKGELSRRRSEAAR